MPRPKATAISCSRTPIIAYDHKLLAYATDTKGSEFLTLRVREIESGRELPDVIEDVAAASLGRPTASASITCELDDNHRTRRVYYHKLGTLPRARLF